MNELRREAKEACALSVSLAESEISAKKIAGDLEGFLASAPTAPRLAKYIAFHAASAEDRVRRGDALFRRDHSLVLKSCKEMESRLKSISAAARASLPDFAGGSVDGELGKYFEKVAYIRSRKSRPEWVGSGPIAKLRAKLGNLMGWGRPDTVEDFVARRVLLKGQSGESRSLGARPTLNPRL